MSEFLFIRPNLISPRDYVWFTYDEDSKSVLSNGVAYNLEELALLKEQAATNKVVFLYPSSSLSFKEIEYPTRVTSRNSNLLLYAIEDELAEDIEELSLKIINKNKKKYSVMIYKPRELELFVNIIEQLGFDLYVAIPDIMAIPVNLFDIEKKISSNNEVVDTDENEKAIQQDRASETNVKNLVPTSVFAMHVNNHWLVRDSITSGYSINDEWFEYIGDKYDKESTEFISLSEVPKNNLVWKEHLVPNCFEVMAKTALESKVCLIPRKKESFSFNFDINLQWLRAWNKVIFLMIAVAVVWSITSVINIKHYESEILKLKKLEHKVYSQITGRNTKVPDPVGEIKKIIAKASVDNSTEFVSGSNKLFQQLSDEKAIKVQKLEFDRNTKIYNVSFIGTKDLSMTSLIENLKISYIVEIKEAKTMNNESLYVLNIKLKEE
ncbi:MAG: type II secretion system protein GspL [Succinivibrionaceae bacterium]